MVLLSLFKTPKYFKRTLIEYSKKGSSGFEKSKELLEKICVDDQTNCHKYKKIMFNVYKDIATEKVIPYAEDVLKKETDINFSKVLAARYRKLGEDEKARRLLH
ncbi:MAG TPA: hypothetical protein ENK66_07140, partial [Arcobacter sp.]|nr:hypothetical protein [Arcobacter sp.]